VHCNAGGKVELSARSWTIVAGVSACPVSSDGTDGAIRGYLIDARLAAGRDIQITRGVEGHAGDIRQRDAGCWHSIGRSSTGDGGDGVLAKASRWKATYKSQQHQPKPSRLQIGVDFVHSKALAQHAGTHTLSRSSAKTFRVRKGKL